METALWIAGIHLAELLAIGIFLIIRKNRKLEQVLIQQQEQINTLDFLFSKLTTSLNSIDEKVWVQGDEELGEVFNDIKEIKEALNSLYN
jgi:hypothetical protein